MFQKQNSDLQVFPINAVKRISRNSRTISFREKLREFSRDVILEISSCEINENYVGFSLFTFLCGEECLLHFSLWLLVKNILCPLSSNHNVPFSLEVKPYVKVWWRKKQKNKKCFHYIFAPLLAIFERFLLIFPSPFFLLRFLRKSRGDGNTAFVCVCVCVEPKKKDVKNNKKVRGKTEPFAGTAWDSHSSCVSETPVDKIQTMCVKKKKKKNVCAHEQCLKHTHTHTRRDGIHEDGCLPLFDD